MYGYIYRIVIDHPGNTLDNGLITKYDYTCPPGFKPGRLPNTVKRKKKSWVSVYKVL